MCSISNSIKERLRTKGAKPLLTNDLGVAAQICDDVLVMQHGRVVEYGPAGQVLGAPVQDYTKALIAAAPGRHWDFANFRPFAEVAE